mgnify:CR=1 FL=1
MNSPQENEQQDDRPDADWHDADWVETLRLAVAKDGQRKVAEVLGCSRPLVSQLLNGTYNSPTDRWRRKVEAEYDRESVPCPILGEISADRCRTERSQGFRATNPIRVRLSQTCPTCRFNPDAHTDTNTDS